MEYRLLLEKRDLIAGDMWSGSWFVYGFCVIISKCEVVFYELSEMLDENNGAETDRPPTSACLKFKIPNVISPATMMNILYKLLIIGQGRDLKRMECYKEQL